MSNLKSCVVDKIVQNCLDLYNKLPKTGKPIENEWTVLSCVVKFDSSSEITEVVSLGTGSKCVGATKMSPKGDILNDSHAEIIARRGFLIYLYDNLEKAIRNEPSMFVKDKERYRLQDNLELIFYSSQLPCGDASIMPKAVNDGEDIGEVLETKRHAEDICDVEAKRQKTEDIHRTGAKCLPSCEQDSKTPGTNYHILGQVRTKPGRGDRTLSVSCSDKFAKWIHMGFHGSLLDLMIEPVYIKHFIFGAGVPYSEESLNRALLNRSPECSVKPAIKPVFYQSSLIFPEIKSEENAKPAPGSIVWIKVNNLLTEVAVHGKKLGVTKKKFNSPSSYLCISKYKLYDRFVSILQKDNDLKQRILGEDASNIPYNKMKSKSISYIKKWMVVKEEFFKIWTIKPDMWDFYSDKL